MSSKSSENLVSKVESYFFEDDDFANLFENFANDNAHLIDENDGENEFKLIYTDLHKKFLVLFEGTLSKFIEGHGATIEDFYEEVRQGFKVNDEGDVANFAKIMMATSDFDVFMMLMRETAETWRKNNPKSNKK